MSGANHRSSGALSAVERDALQAMFDRLSGNYYEVLGVARDCDRAALRGAYFDQLERFNADRYDGRDLGGYGLFVEAIGREINLAFAVLGEPDRRARYDRRLALTGELRVIDEPETVRDTRTPTPVSTRTNPKTQPMYSPGSRATPTPGREVPSPPPAISRDARTPMPLVSRHAPPTSAPQAPQAPQAPPRTPSPETLTAAAPASRRPSQPPPPRPPPSPPPQPARAGNGSEMPSGVTLESINRLRTESRNREAQREAQRNVEDVEALIEKAARGDEHGEVVRLLRHAVSLRPDEPSWRSRLSRAEETFQDHEAQRLVASARAAEKAQRWDTAGDLWAKISDMRPGDAQAALHAAQSLCEAAQDFARAAEYAKRAARLSPDMIAAQLCLTRIFFKAGRTASARAALEQAMKLDPRNPDVIAFSQKLRG